MPRFLSVVICSLHLIHKVLSYFFCTAVTLLLAVCLACLVTGFTGFFVLIFCQQHIVQPRLLWYLREYW